MAGSAIEAGRAFMRLSIDDKAFRRGLLNASRRLQLFGASVARIGGAFIGLGASLAAPLAFAVRSASDAQETFSKFDIVFGSNARAVREWGDTLAGQVGRSKTDIAGFLAGFQDLLVPIGIDPAVAEASSKQLTQLAIDLASFNNGTDANAVRDLQAALTGSSEVMKKYGVISNEAAVKQELLNQSIDPKKATEQQKVFARLAIIMAGTTAAQGDALRTSAGFANSLKAVTGSLFDLGASIGGALLDPLAAFARGARDAIRIVAKFADENQGLIRAYAIGAGAIVAIGGGLIAVGAAFGVVGFAISGFVSAFSVVGAAISAIASPIGITIASVVGLGAAFVAFTDAGVAAVGTLAAAFGPLLGIVQTTVQAVADTFTTGGLEAAAKVALTGLRVAFLEVSAQIQSVWANVQRFLSSAWFTTVSTIITFANRIRAAWAVASAAVQSAWASTQAGITRGVLQAQKIITENLTGQEFDISVELDQSNKALRETLAGIDSNLKGTLSSLQTEQDDTLSAIDEQARQRQREINDELDAAKEAAVAARDEMQGIARGAAGAAAAARAAQKEFASMADEGKAVKDDLKKNAGDGPTGTFSSRAAAQVLGSGVNRQIRVARDQLAEAKKTNELLRKNGGLAFA